MKWWWDDDSDDDGDGGADSGGDDDDGNDNDGDDNDDGNDAAAASDDDGDGDGDDHGDDGGVVMMVMMMMMMIMVMVVMKMWIVIRLDWALNCQAWFYSVGKGNTSLTWYTPYVPAPSFLHSSLNLTLRGHCPSHPTMNKNKVVRRKFPRNSLFWTRNKADLNRARKSSVSGYFQLLPLIHELSPVRHPQCSHGHSKREAAPLFPAGDKMVSTGNKEWKVYKKVDTWTTPSRNSLGLKEENNDHVFPFFK